MDGMHDQDSFLVQNVHALGNAIHRMEEKDKIKKGLITRDDIPKIYSAEMDKNKPQEGRILQNELNKALFLNNTNPSKYNIEFWAEFFNIEPVNLRNVFNYVSYPVLDESEGKIIRILRFLDQDSEGNFIDF